MIRVNESHVVCRQSLVAIGNVMGRALYAEKFSLQAKQTDGSN